MAILHLGVSEKGGVLYSHHIFKSGENHLKIYYLSPQIEHVNILFPFNQDGQIIKLCQAVDALRRIKQNLILNLYIPYFPGARQDRVCNLGESLSVKVYADIINSLKFNSVHVFDPHSEVTPALINNVTVHNNYGFINEVLKDIIIEKYLPSIPNNLVLVSPDAGSNKKIFGLSKHFDGLPIIRADKTRDVKTGEITGTEVFTESLEGKICLMVDDICAGGRTFIELAKKLKEKGASKIYLAVSHYEDVADRLKLKESGIDKVYCCNGIRDVVEDNFLKQFDVFECMEVFEKDRYETDSRMEDRSKVGYF